MAREEVDPRRLQCPSCGAFLQPGLGDQFFCEYCGSPLPDPGQDVFVSQEGEGASEVLSGEAAELDPLGEVAEQASPDLDDAPRRIELRPTRPTRPPSEVPSRGGNRTYAVIVAMILVLVFLGLLGCLLVSMVRARERSDSSQIQNPQVMTVSARSPWQSTNIYIPEGQVATIRYMEGTWGVLDGARSTRKQTDAEGFEGEYRSVGLPLTRARVG